MNKNTYYYLGDILKKIFLLLIMLLLFMPFYVYADGFSSTIVMDVDSGRILYKKDINERKLIASTTKIMTCIIVLENSNIEDEIVVGDEVLSMYGTNIYIEPGEKIKIKDLLYGLMLRSGNDAAITLAYNTLGEDKFIDAMNRKAMEIGMNNTIFKNPHGLDDIEKNYSTAYDMALLAKYAYNNEMYMKIISTKKYVTKSSIKSYVWYNRMELLNTYKYCIGGKNGYTPSAGKSLVSYAHKDNLTLLIVSLNDSSTYENHKYLYADIFSKYRNYIIVDKDKFNLKLIGTDYTYHSKKSFTYPLSSDEVHDILTLVKINSNQANKETDKLEIRLKNKRIGVIDIEREPKKKKEKINFFQKIIRLFVR